MSVLSIIVSIHFHIAATFFPDMKDGFDERLEYELHGQSNTQNVM